MKLGVMLGYWNREIDHLAQIVLAREAERQGFDSAWVAEGYGSDAVSVMAWIGAATSSIRLGAAVLQMPARSPAMTAMSAATLDVLTGGRVILGVGSSGPQVAEGWHGQRFGQQLGRTRDYVAVLRKALAGERVDYRGRTLTLPLPDGPGKPLRLMIKPAQERIPIYLAALGPKNTALCGEIADGIIPTFFSPAFAGEIRQNLAAGAARVGRGPEAIELAPIVSLCISDNIHAARDAVRASIALYVGGMGSKERNFYKDLAVRAGFGEAAERIQDLYLAGQVKAATAIVPDGLIDEVTLCGPADRVRARLGELRDAGVGTLIVAPKGRDDGERLAQLGRIAELM